jgi:O-antigen/teichoic acid export membrane protein
MLVAITPILQIALFAGAKLSFLVVSVLLYKALSLAEIGLFSLIYAIAVILATISECGLRGLLVRDLARNKDNPDDSRRILAGAMKARLLSLTPYFSVGFILGYVFIPGTDSQVLAMLLGATWLDSNSTVFRGALRAYNYIILDAAASCISRIVLVASTACLYRYGHVSLENFAALFLIITFVDTLITFGLVTAKTGVALTLESNIRYTTLMVKRGIPFILITVIGIIYLRIAVLVLGLFPSTSSLDLIAAYNLSGRIPEGVAFLPVALMNAAMPYFARNSGDISTILPVIRKFEKVLGGAGLLLSIGIYCHADALILLLATPQYLVYKPAFQLYGLTIFFSFIQYVNINLLVCMNYEQRVARRYAFILVLNILLSVLLVWKLGLIGAVLALALSEAAAVFVDWHLLSRYGISPALSTVRYWACFALLSIALALLTSTAPGFWGVSTYFLVAAAVGAFSLGQAQISHIVSPRDII